MGEDVRLDSAMVFRFGCIPQLLFGPQGAKSRLIDQMPEEVRVPSKALVRIVSKVEVEYQSAIELFWVGYQTSVCVTFS